MKALILLGGLSSRMGQPKALLPVPMVSDNSSSMSLYIYLLSLLQQAGFNISEIYISLRQSQLPMIQPTLSESYPNKNLLFDSSDDSDIGPAAGLVSALHDNYRNENTEAWLTLAVDFPLV